MLRSIISNFVQITLQWLQLQLVASECTAELRLRVGSVQSRVYRSAKAFAGQRVKSLYYY